MRRTDHPAHPSRRHVPSFTLLAPMAPEGPCHERSLLIRHFWRSAPRTCATRARSPPTWITNSGKCSTIGTGRRDLSASSCGRGLAARVAAYAQFPSANVDDAIEHLRKSADYARLEAVTKATTNPAMTTIATWAAELVTRRSSSNSLTNCSRRSSANCSPLAARRISRSRPAPPISRSRRAPRRVARRHCMEVSSPKAIRLRCGNRAWRRSRLPRKNWA